MIIGAVVRDNGVTEEFLPVLEKTGILLRLLGGREIATDGKHRRLATIQQVKYLTYFDNYCLQLSARIGSLSTISQPASASVLLDTVILT